MAQSSGFIERAKGSGEGPLIGALLRWPWELLRDEMLSGLHARGYTDLTPSHLTLLQYPGPDGLRPSELARRTRMSRQALNYLLGQMEGLGYLRRSADRDDQRFARIHLTDRGQAAFGAVRAIVEDVERTWEQRLEPGEFAQLSALLIRLNEVAVDVGDR